MRSELGLSVCLLLYISLHGWGIRSSHKGYDLLNATDGTAYHSQIDPRALRTSRNQKMQRRACIASRMLSSSVVSPRQTLRELARDHEKLNQLVVRCMRLLTRARPNAPRVCTSVLFIFTSHDQLCSS